MRTMMTSETDSFVDVIPRARITNLFGLWHHHDEIKKLLVGPVSWQLFLYISETGCLRTIVKRDWNVIDHLHLLNFLEAIFVHRILTVFSASK
jgi:hypothetical protein